MSEWNRSVPLQIFGGVHYLVLAGRAPGALSGRWSDFRAAIEAHAPFLRRFVAEQPVQTNEVQRSWMLLPCFLEVARQAGAEVCDVVELGPSAGLNLVWDRYRYRYEAGSWGPSTAPLTLSGDERRPLPRDLLAQRLRVRDRIGIDLDPLDVTREHDALVLKAFVWPDQRERLERLDRAVDAVRVDPPRLVRGDVADLLPDVLAQRQPGAGTLTIVFQTAVLGYLSSDGRRRVREALEDAGRSAPLAYVSSGRARTEDIDGYGLWIQLWPGGDRELVAHADFHGAWLEWLA